MINKIGKSISNYKWLENDFDPRKAEFIKQKYNLSPSISKILSSKNIEINEIPHFLEPTIKYSLPNPFGLLDMDIACNKIIESIKTNKKITIFGDYDVDGATSSALLKRFFAMIGVKIDIYIPDRILEGYGPNKEALLKLKESGTDLVITVDCGTVAFEPFEEAAKAGLDIIVIDHHIGAMEKPKALAIINPNRLDEKFPHKNIAAVAVCFLLIVALNKKLREDGFYKKNNLTDPNLISLLDLVALGTVCDVMPLTGINRAFVAQGLKIMKQRNNIGLRELSDIAKIDQEPSAYHLGFVLGPRINAGGRVGKSGLGAELLATNNNDKATENANLLDNFNKSRKDIEAKILIEADEQILKGKLFNDPVIIAASNNWHQGVIGIIASRIKEKYNKPTAILSIDKDNIGKASCRSIENIDFGSAILKAKLNNIIIAGGGHKMAAGFSINMEKINDLKSFFKQEIGEEVKKYSKERIFYYDDILDINSANLNLVEKLKSLEPFGNGNKKPRFIIKDLNIIKADLIGANKNHIKCIFSAKNLAGFAGNLSAIAFNIEESKMAEILLTKNKGKKLSIVGALDINSWMGVDNLQIIIEDLLY
ncbi:single-stranded-DNA-specific exonuclease RecJ [Rickettsiales bacterium]|nr:single-stranded-DNA-specific exonuclease RecJ [Rickettsiales bacterium]